MRLELGKDERSGFYRKAILRKASTPVKGPVSWWNDIIRPTRIPKVVREGLGRFDET
jgi:hypothetical protein